MNISSELSQMLMLIGGGVLTGLLALVVFFLKRLLADHDKTKSRLDGLDGKFNDLKLSIEQNFVSFDTFETMRSEFRKNFLTVFDEQKKAGEILARLDERSQGDDRLAAVLQVLAKGRK